MAAIIAMLLAGTNAMAQPAAARPADALESATERAGKIQAATGAKPAPTNIPPGDPCTVLPLAEVRKIFPGASAGERSRRLEPYGSTECGWKGPDGQVLLTLQESYDSGTALQDVQGMAQGFSDPMSRAAARNVRFETMNALGVDAAAFVESADAKRGILSDGAMLSLRKGEHTIWLMSGELPRRDRAAALQALEALGRIAAKRL